MADTVKKLSYKAPEELKRKLDAKVIAMRAIGVNVTASEIQRICLEMGLDKVESYFAQERLTR